ncbi:hypothetical protein CC78DRAFT_103098 [Lojkania enalia]|uniref:F-box domain-containing protein n=1 Tax=Lojkania enalia TaxID=147567 RepID=A0A9P4KD54_9PLEO|nr:hypothetical protein CC78DRAFT_103098 [Didymosphaeria enalia]
MARLIDLPRELLEIIYHHLGSIDDVHHLARTCKISYGAIRNDKAYLEIMRSIIRHSPVHRFDIQLCRMLELHNDLVQYFQSGGMPLLPTTIDARGWHNTNMSTYELQLGRAITDRSHLYDSYFLGDALSDNRVYDILARWQGLRIIRDTWLLRELKEEDYLSVSFSGHPKEFAKTFENIQNCSDNAPRGIDVRLSSTTENYLNLDADQEGRFYTAIITIWLMNEVRWILTHFVYPSPSFDVPLKLLQECKNQLKSQAVNPLLDQLETLSMYQFMYQHLLPLHLPALADQNSSKLPFTYSSDLSKEPEHSARFLQLCLLAGQTYLQPPDLIELMVRRELQGKHPYPSAHLSRSTETYIHPSRTPHFFPDYDLGCSNSTSQYTSSLFRECITKINIIQRASISNSLRAPLTGLVLAQPLRMLFHIPDTVEGWLEERCLGEFKFESRADRQAIDNVWEREWKKVRWSIWWWAGSEEKAKMKMERWRCS